jgi:short-subunit dehydrogenase
MNKSSSPLTVLITGATGSIGGALAEVYAEPGNTLILQGRNSERLQELQRLCRSRGARVVTGMLDVRNRDQLTTWLQEICLHDVPDLVIVNAGVNTNIGPEGQGEEWEKVEQLIEVNVLAAMATVHAVLPSLRRRGTGQIALISSLAAYFGLPVTPSYSASKAALKAYGEALRGWLGPEGIRVNVVMPGYVDSPMCRDMPGPKPLLWAPDRAARVIRRGLERNRPRISFPFPLSYGSWWLSVLHPAISERILRLLKYGG